MMKVFSILKSRAEAFLMENKFFQWMEAFAYMALPPALLDGLPFRYWICHNSVTQFLVIILLCMFPIVFVSLVES
jgi:hypothetical protein